MGKGICHANLMAVFEPRDPHKSWDKVASIWNPSTLIKTGRRDRKFSPKLLGQLTYSPKCKTVNQNNVTGKDPPQLSKGCPVTITYVLRMSSKCSGRHK